MTEQLPNNSSAGEEIQISELIGAVQSGWKQIAVCTGIGIVAAAAIAWSVAEKYEVAFYLDKPYPSDIATLNLGRTKLSGLPPVTAEQLYDYYVGALSTDAAKHRFFYQIYLPAQKEQPASEPEQRRLLEKVVSKQVAVTAPQLNKGRQSYRVRIEAPSSEQAVQWAKQFIDQTEEDAKKAWLLDSRAEINLAIENIERDLADQRDLAQKQRQDRRAQLQEALTVAKAVGMEGPQVTTGLLPRQDSLASFADGSRLYARGAKSLESELQVLESRKDDTPFIEGLREAETKLRSLQEQQPETQKFHMYRVDGDILEPTSAFFPKKALFLAAGAILGLGLGLLLALRRAGIFKKMF